jgi:hypothetical protein
MTKPKRRPTTPGEILREEFLAPLILNHPPPGCTPGAGPQAGRRPATVPFSRSHKARPSRALSGLLGCDMMLKTGDSFHEKT